MSEQRFYVYGLFYENEDENNICFYVGRGTKFRKDRHFMEWNLENGYNEKKKEIIRKTNNEKLHAKVLQENLTLEQAEKLEEKLLLREDIWKSVTNKVRSSKGFRAGKENPNYDGLSDKHKKKIGEANKKKNRSEDQKIQWSKNGKNSQEEKVVSEVKWLVENTDLFQKEISDYYGISKGAVSRIANEKSYWYVEPEKPSNIPDKTIERNKERSKSHKQKLALSNTKLAKNDVREIRWLYEETNMSQKDISEKYPTSRKSVSNIVNKKTLSFVNGKKKPV